MSSISALRARVARDGVLGDALRHEQILPERDPQWADALPPGFELLKPVLEARGIERVYTHQARALEHVARGENVALATATASGKTLVYNLPALRAALGDPPGRALYLFPLKALARDQQQRLEADAAALGVPIDVAIYDGDTPQGQRRKIRQRPPSILITTPDMLHAGILPSHASWETFFRGLSLVVIDELHSYRGVFGSHVAQVLRRLLRVARFHGRDPQVIAASATIGNAGELASGLTGRPFQVVAQDGAPRTRRHLWVFDPSGSPYTAAARLFRASIRCGLRTLAFTKARRITELMHAWVIEAEPGLRDRVSSYRAGFLPGERREIERRLFAGELLGVISTSALEMGIDVGALDVCILVGYPGSQVSLWQRGGRVGREREAAIAVVAQPDALDQYLVRHPSLLVDHRFEHAVVDPANDELLAAHLPCAAAESPLRAGEPWLAEPAVAAAVARLEEDGALLASETGREWFAARRRPHREVSLRNVGSAWTIETRASGEEKPRAIGSIGGGLVHAECHEGAIYLHLGRQFLVTRLDEAEQTVTVRPVEVPWYTRALSDKETEVLSRDRARPAGNFRLVEGRVRVTTHVRGYERRRVHGQDLLGSEPLDLPPRAFETRGVWLEIPDEVPAALETEKRHPMGGLHGIEHAALALFPLFALCDRLDVAGITTTRHAQLGRAAIFLYDGHPGGVGLVSSLFDRFETLLEATLERIAGCECEEGCPACIHSPRCSNGNRPLDKAGSVRALRLLLGHEPLPEIVEAAAPATDAVSEGAAPEAAPGSLDVPAPRVVFFDLETQRSAADVGGWHNAHLMRMALAVTWDSRSGAFRTFREAEVEGLLAQLAEADLVVGFNVVRFDYRVLRGYTDRDFGALATFDMLDAIHARLGYRLSLAHLAEETLGAGKSGDGLQSIAWWREGRHDLVESYCRRDVEILRQLFEHATRTGHLIFRTRDGERVKLPARWSLEELVETAAAKAGARA
ncbi:MAG TPA: DEAD/DEAH box helicase [Myxococcota bacterium]|nr:DEAD/DEAH box helicase [Myxococcota bacterium]